MSFFRVLLILRRVFRGVKFGCHFFSYRSLLLSTSVLNDNTKDIGRCKIIGRPRMQLITMLKVAITVSWVSYACMMVVYKLE